ncbi:MAG: hypothetical protein LBI28_10125 [Treponema sp.]|jgi:hypothetical protein|nr:hypothetical protein [Treponema sp.]
MYNEIIFVDFENFTKIIEDIKKANAKIVVLVGVNQSRKPFVFAKELLESVSSVELLKVKGQGNNALDFFIAYYLGVYTNRNKNLKFTICSNDKGYDPLIKHLSDNGINIKRTEIIKKGEATKSESEDKNTSKQQKQNNLFETDKDYKKAFTNIKDIPAKNRPRKINGFEAHLETLFHKTVKKDKIKKIAAEFKKLGYVEIENNEKLKYNM